MKPFRTPLVACLLLIAWAPRAHAGLENYETLIVEPGETYSAWFSLRGVF